MSNTHAPAGIDRRGFLKLLPAGTAALTLSSPMAYANLPSDVDDGRLPLAHFPPLKTTMKKSNKESGRVFDAYRMEAGDDRFLVDAARLTLHGLYPAEALWEYSDWAALQLEVVYNRAANLRQIAWCCENRQVANIGSAVSLRVPILQEQGLCLAGILRDHQDHRHSFELQLVTGHEQGMAKLKRGLYLAALSPYGSINWRKMQLNIQAKTADQQRELFRRSFNGMSGDQAAFPYLAFSVDYAEKLPT